MTLHLLRTAKDGYLRLDIHALTMTEVTQALWSVVEVVVEHFGTDERLNDARAAVWAESCRVANSSNMPLFGASASSSNASIPLFGASNASASNSSASNASASPALPLAPQSSASNALVFGPLDPEL